MPHTASDDSTGWQRVQWPDGSRYEGLVKGNLCHVRGVTVFPDGDRYEGEFVDNHMEGMGVYTWHDGTVYEGSWKGDKMHGCAVKRSMQESGEVQLEVGHFKRDQFMGPSTHCDAAASQQAAQLAQKAARQSRGLLQVNAAQRSQQAVDLPPLLSHCEAFSMQRQNRQPKLSLRGGHQQLHLTMPTVLEPAAVPLNAAKQTSPAIKQASPATQQTSPVTKQRLPGQQFWLPWSLWHP